MVDESSLEPVEPEPDRPAAPVSDLARRRFASAELHFGPLPHPDHYERYADIIPDGANRIMAMVKEQARRHLMERLGMASAYTLALAFLVAGSILVLNGHDWAGAVIITSTVVALVSVFITGAGGIPNVIRRDDGQPPDKRGRSN